MNPSRNTEEKLDQESSFIAGFLSWARKVRVYGTSYPMISYRGHANGAWKLLPSLCRQKHNASFLKQYEKEVIEEFRRRYSLVDWQDIDVLAYARHHGAPTRLVDWSLNPLIGLWFAVSDKELDTFDAVVFQLNLLQNSEVACVATRFKLESADECACKKPVHVFSSPPRIERTDRQRSVFSITTFKDDLVLTPLDNIKCSDKKPLIRDYTVPARLKPKVRRLLSDLGLDAFSIYGDPDSFGRSLAAQFDISDVQSGSK